MLALEKTHTDRAQKTAEGLATGEGEAQIEKQNKTPSKTRPSLRPHLGESGSSQKYIYKQMLLFH